MDIASVAKAFQSERLIYRSPEDNDKDKEFFFRHVENDPAAKALADPSVLRPKNKKGVEEFLTELHKSTLAVVLCLSPAEAKKQNIESEEPVPIGFICIGWGGNPPNREQHRATHIGIMIVEAFRNKGYGGESINWALDWAFSCALCGLGIPSPHIGLEDQQQRLWWRKIFAVQREEGQSHFSLTPVGYSQDGRLEAHPVIRPNEGFFIHQACWPIYCDKMFSDSGRSYGTEQILQVLFDFQQSLPGNADGWISFVSFINDTQASSDAFSKLSTELNHGIIDWLDSVSFCNLRLASKTVANLTKPADLPQTFWASRFHRDHEMNFFPMEYDRTETWRDLYFNLKQALKDTSKTGHMRNRLRIWNGLGMITPYMVAILDQRPRLENTARCREELVSVGYEMTQKTQGFGGESGRHRSKDIYVKGSRYLNLRLGGAWISVTTMNIDGRPYILGFRVRGRDHTEKFRIGLINTKAETEFLLKPSDQVIAVKVATTFGGIVGLAFRIKDELGGVDWKLVGKVDKPDDYVGIKLLRPQNGGYISGLLLGLDACKVVSVQLVEKLGDATAMDRPGNSGQHVWHPGPPQPDVVTILPPAVDQPALILNTDFGGPSGSLLPLLTRVAIFHDALNHKFKGLGFYYTDGTEREFGFREVVTNCRWRDTTLELSFPIDGPAGERIIGLRHYAVLPHSFKIITSFGMTAKMIELKEDPKRPEMKTLVSPNGEAITGFLAQMIPPLGHIESLGLVHLDHLESSQPKSPSTALKYYYQTYERHSKSVRLNNVKRIGISCGREGRSRRPEHVSGFCFEFWGKTHPVYVGQWFKEIGHLDVCEGERITSFTFWNELVGCAYNNDRSTKYSGVRIEKSGPEPNAVEVHPGPHRNMHESCYTENRFERLDSFVWDVFHDRDTTNVRVKPSPLAKNCLSRMPEIRDGVCTKSDKIFWEIEDGKGGWTRVSQIATFFNPDTKGLCGLEFTYSDNQIRRGGYTEGEKTTLKAKRHKKVTGASTESATTTTRGDILDVSVSSLDLPESHS
ncbi:hypothetical protein FMUND_15646 [Fusarium mundagurra]|uniref:N-acetyltransferase domain-containing protein n=1 Tax=Fusarium mundagurra TaxID=1567541 RepID=A0A8H5XNG7_9HYPO|nr:hypothetical protein FMUND_15646 [Fusarium mundagurra]